MKYFVSLSDTPMPSDSSGFGLGNAPGVGTIWEDADLDEEFIAERIEGMTVD